MPRLYQNIPLEGIKWENKNRVTSRFWNEGKWNNFVKPFLPKDCSEMSFVEMGCNAGLFLKLAEDAGFKNVLGIEKNRTPVKEGLRYRDSIGYHYNMLKRTLGGEWGEEGTFNLDEIPMADVTLMSTFHYYIDINAWIKYLDKLKTKTCQVIIVSRPDVEKRLWLAQAQLGPLKNYFKDWECLGVIDNIPKEGDPSPREMFSVSFKSPLVERIPIKDIRREPYVGRNMNWSMLGFAKALSENPNMEPLETDWYKAWSKRKEGMWTEEDTKSFVQGKYKIMRDVMFNGIREPILISGSGKIADGGHRLAILEALGATSVIVRRI